MYRKEQFSKMIHNPFGEDPIRTEASVKVGRLGRALQGIEKYRPKNDIGRVSQFILFMYDKESPLRRLETDIDRRKKVSAQLSGFDEVKESNKIHKLSMLANDDLRLTVMNFVRFQNSKKWSALVTNEQLLWEIQSGIIREYTEFRDDKQLLDAYDAKTKLSQKADWLIGIIEKYEQDLFAGDEEAKESALQIRAGSSPESFAENNVYKTPEQQ